MPPRNTIHLDQALADPGTDKRLDILRLVGECGSISEAARRAGVSYKAGWQAVDTLSNLAGTSLVERAVGGAGGGGAHLTPAGEQLLQMAARLAQARQQVMASLGGPDTAASLPGGLLPALALRTSMRNQLPCTVRALRRLQGMVVVELGVGGGQTLVSRVTRESVQLLGLARGAPALALFKATAVRITATETGASDTNRLAGTVVRTGRTDGAELALALPGGSRVVGFAAPGQKLRAGTTAHAAFDPAAVVVALPG